MILPAKGQMILGGANLMAGLSFLRQESEATALVDLSNAT